MQRPQYAFKCFLVAAMILGRLSARAGQFRTHMIAGIGIQPLFQESARGQPAGLPPRGCLPALRNLSL